MSKCAIHGCKSLDCAITYFDKDICDKCWEKFTSKPPNALRKALGFRPLPVETTSGIPHKESE